MGGKPRFPSLWGHPHPAPPPSRGRERRLRDCGKHHTVVRLSVSGPLVKLSNRRRIKIMLPANQNSTGQQWAGPRHPSIHELERLMVCCPTRPHARSAPHRPSLGISRHEPESRCRKYAAICRSGRGLSCLLASCSCAAHGCGCFGASIGIRATSVIDDRHGDRRRLARRSAPAAGSSGSGARVFVCEPFRWRGARLEASAAGG